MGFVLLVVTWAAAAWCARALSRRAGVRAAAVDVALAAGMLAVIPGELARFTGSLRIGMAVAAVAFAAVALALRPALLASVRAPRSTVWPAWPAVVAGVVGLACVIDGALTRNFFDEEHHVPMATVIARGVVPPVHPLVPGQIIPYHWGIDALYAQLVVAGLRPDTAINVVTIASWLLLLGAAALLGGLVAGRVGATIFAVVAPLAGSPLAQPLHDGMGILQLKNPYPARWMEWTRRPPPLTADFFQHPQGLAFPLVLVVLALWCARFPARLGPPDGAAGGGAADPVDGGADDPGDRAEGKRRALAALLLSFLSLVQAIHFLVLGFGLGASTVWLLARRRERPAGVARDLGLLAGALALAVAYGGFFAVPLHAHAGPPMLRWGVDFFADGSPIEKVLHHLVVFGLPLLLLPVAAWRSTAGDGGGRLRVTLVAGALIGLSLPNVVVYAGSWDIVKLCSAGGWLAGIALCDTLAWAWTRATSRARVWRAAVVVAAGLTVWFPLAWMATRTVMQSHFGVPQKRDWRLRDDVLAAGRAAGPHIPSRARVLVGDPELARMNGLLAPGFDPRHYANGHMLDFDKARRLASARQVAMRTLDPESLRVLDVDYALLNNREVAQLGPKLAPFKPVRIDVPGYALYRLR